MSFSNDSVWNLIVIHVSILFVGKNFLVCVALLLRKWMRRGFLNIIQNLA